MSTELLAEDLERLRLARALEAKSDDLVREARRLLESAPELRTRRDETGNTQLRNLLAVASQTDSFEVVANYIRYQLGRAAASRSWSVWTLRAGGMSFGEALNRSLEFRVTELAREALNDAGVSADSPLGRATQAQAMRLFLGYLYRHHVFLHQQALQERPQQRHGGSGRGNHA